MTKEVKPNTVQSRMPEILVLVRHGHSEGQRAAELEKQGDLSAFTETFRNTSSSLWNLTKKGFKQACQTAQWLETFVADTDMLPNGQFDKGYFSPYMRSRQTMGALLLGNLVKQATTNERLAESPFYFVNPDLRLRELDFGVISTIPRQEFHDKYPDSVAARKIDPVFGRTPGGESISDVMDRSRSFLGALARAHDRGVNSAIVVSHGRQIRSTQLALEGIDMLEWTDYDRANEIKNCQTVLYSRRNPEDGTVKPTFGWTASVCPWEAPDAPPEWREFSAPTVMTAADCLKGIPKEWLQTAADILPDSRNEPNSK